MPLLHTSLAVLREQAVAPRLTRVPRARAVSFVLFVVLFVVLAAQLVIRLQIIEESYRLEQLRPLVMKNDARLRELRFTYAQITTPRILTERAIRELQMDSVAPDRVRAKVDGSAVSGEGR